MALLSDLLKQVLAENTTRSGRSGRNWPQGTDKLMEHPQLPATEGDSAGKIMKPAQMQAGQAIAKDPRNIYNDAGQIVDYDTGSNDGMLPALIKKLALSEGAKGRPDKTPAEGSRAGDGNPFSNLLSGKGNGEGTLSGWISRMFSPTPMEQQTDTVQGRGTVGGGDPNRGTPGTGIDPGLDPTPTEQQKVPALQPGTPTPRPLADAQPAPPPVDYAMPNAMDPNQIEELRNSILSQTQQMNPNYPDGLSGRMNSPYSQLDQKEQMSDAQRQADQLNSNKNYYNN